MQFSEVIGQAELKKSLLGILEKERLAHALLFHGEYGFGGLSLALAFTQYLFCKDRDQGDSCGKCSSCVKVNKLIHPDLHFSFPVNSNSSSSSGLSDEYYEDWRQFVSENPYFDLKDWNERIGLERKQSMIKVKESSSIIKKLNLKSYEAGYKVLIMWGADKMNADAANRLLKLIEEPAEKTLIILLTEEREALLKTIVSRTQPLRVPPIQENELKKSLLEKKAVSETEAERISRLADGNWVNALRLMERQDEEEQFFQLFTEWMRACYEANVERIYNWVEEISSKSYGREKQKRFLSYVLNQMREGIIRNYQSESLQRIFGKEDEFMKRFSPFIIGDNILEINDLINKAHYHIERNAYPKIVFMDMSMQFANLLRAKNRKFARS